LPPKIGQFPADFNTPQLENPSGQRHCRATGKLADLTRKPLLDGPDVWVQQVFAEFDGRAAAGEKGESLE
jgi:hypothetical protein